MSFVTSADIFELYQVISDENIQKYYATLDVNLKYSSYFIWIEYNIKRKKSVFLCILEKV